LAFEPLHHSDTELSARHLPAGVRFFHRIVDRYGSGASIIFRMRLRIPQERVFYVGIFGTPRRSAGRRGYDCDAIDKPDKISAAGPLRVGSGLC
jgi:hypothetical protein